MILFGFEVFFIPFLSSVDTPGGHPGGDVEGGVGLGGQDLSCREHCHSQRGLQTTYLGKAEVRKDFTLFTIKVPRLHIFRLTERFSFVPPDLVRKL